MSAKIHITGKDHTKSLCGIEHLDERQDIHRAESLALARSYSSLMHLGVCGECEEEAELDGQVWSV